MQDPMDMLHSITKIVMPTHVSVRNMITTNFAVLGLPLTVRRQFCTSPITSFRISTLAPLRSFDSHPTRHSTSFPASSTETVCPHFKHTEATVDYLTSITKSELLRLRHMSVRGIPLPIRHACHLYPPKDKYHSKPYDFHSVLPLFPGLQLDTLTVYDAYHGEGVCEDVYGHWGTYREIEGFVKRVKGFRELVFISANDRCLNSNYLGGWNAPQPNDNRDGDDAIPWDNEIYGGGERSAKVDRYLEVIKIGVEITVRRGTDADYVQDGKSLCEYDDELYAIFAQLSWKEIKEQGLFLLRAEDDPLPYA